MTIVGKTISNYRVLEELGQGGMGIVYLAQDTQLLRNVALKVLHLNLAASEGLKARFLREAQAGAILNHPGIVTVYGIGEDNGVAFIVMEYVEGHSLEEKIASKGLSFEESFELFLKICEGIGAAHKAGVVHRDVKPSNIMVQDDGRIKILDFGLAKLKDLPQITQTGMIMGTPYYMSPEQFEAKEPDHRSDIFALGVLFYKLLTGEMPFKGDTGSAVRMAIVNDRPIPLREHSVGVPKGVQKIIEKALEKDPGRRYQSTDELVAMLTEHRKSLTEFTSGLTSTATRQNLPEPSSLARNRKPVMFIYGSIVLVVSMLLYFFPTSNSGSNEKPIAVGSPAELSTRQIVTDSGDHGESSTKKLDTEGTRDERKRSEGDQIMKAESGTIKITSNPAGAAVFFNNQPVGTTPYEGNHTEGDIDVAIRLAGYQEYKQDIPLKRPKLKAELTAQLIPLPGTLIVTSQPEAARVIVDGGRRGSTPSTIQLEPRDYGVEVEKEGFLSQIQRVQILPGETREVVFTLQRAFGTAAILVKPYGSIFVDGKQHEKSSDQRHKIELSVGRHKVKAVHPSFGTWEEDVVVRLDRETVLTIDFQKEVEVTIGSKPTWGYLFVDNEAVGETPKQLTLRVGLHTIEVRREGYSSRDGKKVVNIHEGFRDPILFNLD